MNRSKLQWLVVALLAFTVILSACQPQTTEVEVTRVVTEVQEVEVEVMVEVTPEPEPYSDVPFEEQWAGSAHAAAETEAFRHWDEDDPPEIPASCAKCHSAPGMLDFLGVDGDPASEAAHAGFGDSRRARS